MSYTESTYLKLRTPAAGTAGADWAVDLAQNNTLLDGFATGAATWHGFYDRTATLSFTAGSRTLAITGSHSIYINGTKYTKSTTSIVISTTTGLHYVYYDATGTITDSLSAWNLKTVVPIATVWWSGSAGALVDERHGYQRNLDWHANAHWSIGARWQSGCAVTVSGTGASGVISTGSGTMWDEDLQHTLSAQSNCRVWYLTAASTYTFADTAYPYVWNGSTSKVRYVNSSYALADMTASQYLPVWVYVTGDTSRSTYVYIPRVDPYASISAARVATPPDLSASGLNPELKLIYRILVKGDGDSSASEILDYRTSGTLPSGGATTTTAAAVPFVASGTIAATNVQAALEELDSEKAPSASPTITGGTINNTVIGGTTPAAGTFTTITGSGALNVDSGVLYVDTVNNRVGVNTTAPNSMVEVVGATAGTGSLWNAPLAIRSNDSLAADMGGGVTFVGPRSATGPTYINYATIRGVKENATDDNTGGYLLFQVRAHGLAIAERMRITGLGNVVIGTAALATSATAGFPWIPSCPGAPTGAPTAPYTNAAALVVDTSNNRLYVLVGSTWRYATLT